MMHRMASNADHSSADAGDDCMHDCQIVESTIALVEEDIHPPCGLVGVGLGFTHQSSILDEHLDLR